MGDFWVLTPPILSNITTILNRGSSLANKNNVWNIFEGFNYLWKRDGPQVSTFGTTMAPLFLLSSNAEKFHPLIQICQNEVFISSPFFGKNTITFCNIWDIFTRKQDGVTNQMSRTKIWQIIFYPHDSWSTSCKKIGLNIFQFCCYRSQSTFKKNFTWIFKFDWFSWYHSYII